MKQDTLPAALAAFYAKLGLHGENRARQLFANLRRALGDAEAKRIDATLSKPEQFLRLEALFYVNSSPPLELVRAAVSGTWQPSTLPPTQMIPGQPIVLKTRPHPVEPPAPGPGAGVKAELAAMLRDPRYARDRDPATVAKVEAAFRIAYPSKVPATSRTAR
jgi:hypothetical protein